MNLENKNLKDNKKNNGIINIYQFIEDYIKKINGSIYRIKYELGELEKFITEEKFFYTPRDEIERLNFKMSYGDSEKYVNIILISSKILGDGGVSVYKYVKELCNLKEELLMILGSFKKLHDKYSKQENYKKAAEYLNEVISIFKKFSVVYSNDLEKLKEFMDRMRENLEKNYRFKQYSPPTEVLNDLFLKSRIFLKKIGPEACDDFLIISNYLEKIKDYELIKPILKNQISKEEVENYAKNIKNTIYQRENFNNLKEKKDKISKSSEKSSEDKTNKKAHNISESFKIKFKKESEKLKERTKSKLKEKKNKIISAIFKIILAIVVIFSFYLIYNFEKIGEAIILTMIFLVIYVIFNKKSLGSALTYIFSFLAIYFVFYILLSRGTSRVICIFTGICPREITRDVTEKSIDQIKSSVIKTIDEIRKIMENPELAYIDIKAESVATRDSYKYLFEVRNINEIPINYVFYSDNEEIKEIYSLPLYHAVRYSLPVDKEFNIVFKAYCLIEPLFEKNCILQSMSQDLGTLRIYDNKEVFLNETLNYYPSIKIQDKIGITNILCTIPRFYLDLSECSGIIGYNFYINNHMLVMLSNIETKTVYKFLVIDENTLVRSILDGRDIYDYLKLNREEYDRGYFEGFLDFPKINILRLGVLSDYPIIKFRDINSVNDFIYVSLVNIKEIYDVNKFEIEIIYNPQHIDINLDSKFDKIKTQLYEFSCRKNTGRIICNAVFNKFYDYFGRNQYIIHYKTNLEKFFFFIPISISFSNNFTEYSEVIINARAEYNLEKLITTELEYRLVKINS